MSRMRRFLAIPAVAALAITLSACSVPDPNVALKIGAESYRSEDLKAVAEMERQRNPQSNIATVVNLVALQPALVKLFEKHGVPVSAAVEKAQIEKIAKTPGQVRLLERYTQAQNLISQLTQQLKTDDQVKAVQAELSTLQQGMDIKVNPRFGRLDSPAFVFPAGTQPLQRQAQGH